MKARRRWVWRRGNEASEILVTTSDGRSFEVAGPGGRAVVDSVRLPGGRTSVILPSARQISGHAAASPGGGVAAWAGGRRLALALADPLSELASHGDEKSAGASVVVATIPGRVVEVRVCEGDVVAAGATLLVLEAMKMQNEIRSEARARVGAVECSAGQTVETGAVLVRLDPVEPG